MAKHQILEYTIWLRDAAKVLQVQQWVAAFGVGGTATIPGQLITQTNGVSLGIYKSPLQAGIDYDQYVGGDGVPGLPYKEVGVPAPVGGPGYITSGWFTPSYSSYPRDQKTFEISTGWWLFGSTTIFYWAGKVRLAPGVPITVGTPIDQLPAQAIQRRYFLCGFEHTRDAEMGGVGGGASPGLDRKCLAASRTGDGWGARCIQQDNVNLEAFDLDTLCPPVTPAVLEQWQRFYLRPLRYGSETMRCWAAQTSTYNAFYLGLTATGQLALFKRVYTGPAVLLSTFGQTTLNAWSKIDVFLHCDTVQTSSIEVRLNGVLVGSGTSTGGITESGPPTLDRELSGVRRRCDGHHGPGGDDHELDVDDWVCGALPLTQSATLPVWAAGTPYVVGNVVRHASLPYVALLPSTGQTPGATGSQFWALAGDPADLLEGSHIVRVAPDGFGPAHDPAWVGDVRTLLGRARYGSITACLTSSTPDAVLELTVPLDEVADLHPQSLGIAAFRVLCYSSRNGGASAPTFGYQVGSEPPVLTPIPSEGTFLGDPRWEATTGPAVGALLPTGETLRLQYVKGADAVEAHVQAYEVTVELLGSFGPEDRPAGDATVWPAPIPVHQAPWPSTPWAHDANPLGPVIIRGSTYVGNGTGQDLLLPLPPAWLLIHPVTVSSHNATRWWPSMLGPHLNAAFSFEPDLPIVTVDRDHGFVAAGPDANQQMQFRVRLGGSVQTNSLGVTYQYCALLDPAGRFSRAFATSARPTGTLGVPGLPRAWPLDDPTFLPEAGQVWGESSLPHVTPVFFWKHPGLAADAAVNVEGSVLAPDALTFGTGTLTVRTDLVDDEAEQYAAILFRRADGNPAAAGTVVFTGSYVGDGAASRTVGFGSTGNRPLYAHVGPAPASAAGTHFHRDPSHTGSNSTRVTFSGVVTTTAITAGGPDSFTVGIELNATGVLYGYWGLYGGPDACENGWSCNGDFLPTPTDSTMPPGWVTPVPGPEEPGPGPEPEPGPDGPGACGDDCAEDCVAWSTHLVNLGLSSIGITDAVTDLGVDLSRQAGTARLHYRLEIDAVLRAYPWKFATRYATLVLEDGAPDDPDNPDWVYRYALPLDCLLVRRIVPPRPGTDPAVRTFSHAAIPFAYVESDDGLPFLVSDAADVTIEYTARPTCPGKVRDPIFKRACTWRLAHAFAAPLGRDKTQLEQAYQLYEQQIQLAQARDTTEQQPLVPSGRYLDPGGLTTDCAEGCLDYSTHLANLALSSLGMPETITSLKTDPSGPAMLARLHYKAEIDATLRAHPWKFATRYATLLTWAEMDPPVVPDPAEVLTNPEWAHQYVLPADVLLVRRVVQALPAEAVAGTAVPDYQRQFTETTVPFDYMESDSGAAYLMSNAVPVTIEYTARVPCPAKARDPLFIRACAWRLAHAMAAPLKVDKAISDQAYQLYRLQIDEAQARDQNQQSPQNPVHIGEAEWIRGRE